MGKDMPIFPALIRKLSSVVVFLIVMYNMLCYDTLKLLIITSF